MYKLLIVDDEERIRTLIKKYALLEGYSVSEACNGLEAVRFCQSESFDIIIMDIMMPELDGFSAVKALREFSQAPVIMLSARGEEYDKLHGFELGVDDYVVKPFSPRELIARIKAVIRRKGGKEEGEVIRIGPLVIDIDRFEARVSGEPLRLSAVEFRFLALFAKHPGRVYSRAQLIERIWGFSADIDERTVDVHMLRLRKQLSGTEAADFIETVRGLGYRAAALKSSQANS